MILSRKQKRFLDFIQEFTRNSGQPPTFEEIKAGLGFRSLGTVNWYVRELINNGYLRQEKGFNGKRALTVVEEEPDHQLPLAGRIAAGRPLEAIENQEMIDVPSSFVHPSHYALQVKGNSMTGESIEDGDFIIVRKTDMAVPGDMVVAYVNEEATLKKYYPTQEGIELHPQNPDYDIIHVAQDDSFRIGGVVLGVIRKY
ncbi:MAG: transcriptional repressor LexA [Fidelibacterota bacterium]